MFLLLKIRVQGSKRHRILDPWSRIRIRNTADYNQSVCGVDPEGWDPESGSHATQNHIGTGFNPYI
jgi:hypothetical protein